jgi:hypothetical protein
MRLDIPPEDREILRRWFSPKDESAEKVIAALEKAKPALTPTALAHHVARETGVEADAAVDLLFTLCNLAQTVEGFEAAERPNTSEMLFRSIFDDGKDAPERSQFNERVKRILDCKSIQITSKALGVLTSNPNTFCAARTLSELRPVFGETDLDPEAALIVHQLKLEYHVGPGRNERREIFIAMDRADVEKLMAVLKRAIEKDDKLRGVVGKLDLPLL